MTISNEEELWSKQYLSHFSQNDKNSIQDLYKTSLDPIMQGITLITLSIFFQKKKIIHETSCVDTCQQNRMAERKNRYVLKVIRTLLFQSNVPKKFWSEAVLTAAYLINRYGNSQHGHGETISPRELVALHEPAQHTASQECLYCSDPGFLAGHRCPWEKRCKCEAVGACRSP